MGRLVLVSGPPGAGKSTVAGLLARRSGPLAVHLRTDDFWRSIVAGSVPPYEPAAHGQNQTVLRVIAAAAFGYADGGYVTVVDGVVGPWMLGHVRAEMSRHPEVPVDYVVLRPRREVALARAQGRDGVEALVDREPVLAMWAQFAGLGELERHVVDTSDEAAEHSADRVASALASGRFRLPG